EATKQLGDGGGPKSRLSLFRRDLREFVQNRLLHTDEPVDASASALCIEGIDFARPRRLFAVSFGAHATTLGPDNTLASGDSPGEPQNCAFEEPGPPTPEQMFFAGAVGSQSPRRVDSFGERILWEFSGKPPPALVDATELELRAFDIDIELPHASPRLGHFR